MWKKFVAAILGGLLAFGMFQTPTFAEVVEADGEYIMGDGTEENQVVAKERARKEAVRAASEKAALFVESITEVKNGQLTNDQIRTISANVMKVISAIVHPVVVGDTIKFVCHATVDVDRESVVSYINNNDQGKIDEATQRIKELEAENARINAELEALKKRAVNASQTERIEINTAIKRNEQQFTALQYTEQGATFYDKREYKKAIDALNKALNINPDYSNAWSWLGAVYNDMGDTDKAIEYNRRAIEIDPNNALAWNNLGVSYSYLGDNAKSIEYYRKAAQLDPNLIYPWGNLGRLYAETGNLNKAFECANRAVELHPKYAYSWISLGIAWTYKGDHQKAQDCYRKATELDPKLHLAWVFLGDSYLAVKNQAKAEECFNRTIDILRRQTKTYPNDSMGWGNLGGVYLRLKKFNDAIGCFRKATEINPNNLFAWTGLGFAYYNLGNYNDSLKALNRAVELAPNNADIRKNRDAVASYVK